jgi:hypothetical protein
MKSSKDAEIIAKASDESRTGLRKWLIDRLRSPHLKRFHNLYLSEQERIEIRDHYCQICGKPKKDPTIYFGQTFCRQCVEKCDPQNIYQKIKMLSHEWKIPMKKLFGK